MRALGVFAKWPTPGKVKTRLAQLLGDDKAAEVAKAFLQDTLYNLSSIDAERFLVYTPVEDRPSFESLGRAEFKLLPQMTGDLGQRLSGFVQSQFDAGATQVVVMGTDSPTLPTHFVEQAFNELTLSDVVLGPATDGGYYLLGAGRPIPQLFENVDWSTSNVLHQTVQQIETASATLALLPPWYDVDTPDEWRMLLGHLAALRHAQTDSATPKTERLARER